MTVRDLQGLAVSGASSRSLSHFETALSLFRCYRGDPLAETDAALADSPGFAMAHVLRAYLHLLGTESAALPAARASYARAAALAGTERERGHVAAIGALLDGHWHRAGHLLEDVAIDHPHDTLALQAGHQIDFFCGHARMLRDRIARALQAWRIGRPGYHALLGMYAFGLEENGDYARAEAAGRQAVVLEPHDAWAQHAVAHVLEMQSRQREGIAWMRANCTAWTADSFFQIHNWWHLALYHLELGEYEQVLELYDGPIAGDQSALALDLIDASALLWRLQLQEVDVGNRWEVLAARWEPLAEAGHYAFNDVHAMMAFASAGHVDAAQRLLAAQQRARQGDGDNVRFTAEVGQPVALAIQAFVARRYAECVRLLRAVRPIAQRFGGSHAQRDLLDLTLIEAALRGGQLALARALCAERLQLRPSSPLARRLRTRVTTLTAEVA
ncbi:tetratricopeptide repeat protein [Zestomonas insulae]|uniref:tetratricopeptide repeat protein n=1 Tax=Zestomonas insulae TaxID=2809017 RepID=UPI001EF6AC41|nr:tetratricopeptide repeat protein [Pseudomonas insulae]